MWDSSSGRRAFRRSTLIIPWTRVVAGAEDPVIEDPASGPRGPSSSISAKRLVLQTE